MERGAVSSRVHQFRKHPNRLRLLEITGPGNRSVSHGYDGSEAWQMSEHWDMVVSAGKITNRITVRLIEIDAMFGRPLSAVERYGRNLRVLGRELLNPSDSPGEAMTVHIVEADLPTGEKIKIGVHSQHHQEVFLEIVQGEMHLRMEYGDYRKVEGYFFPFQLAFTANGERVLRFVTESVTVNPILQDAFLRWKARSVIAG